MLNQIMVMGRLTADPELRRTQDGKAVVSFSLAVERDFKDRDGRKQTDFIDVVAWRQTAEFIMRYFSKGSMVVISGRLQIRPWTDNSGAKRKSAEIVAENVYFGASFSRDKSTMNDQEDYATYDDPDLPWNMEE